MISSRALRILVVDDDEIDRMAVTRALRNGSFEVELIEAADADTAWAMLQKVSFDAMFLDYHLPGLMTGLDLLQKLRARDASLPVIALTGQGNEEVAVALMKAGASDYLPKRKLTSSILDERLPRLVRMHRIENELHRTQQRLSIAVSAGQIGIWEMLDDHVEASVTALDIMGLSSGKNLSLDEFFCEAAVEEDRSRVSTELHELESRSVESADIEYRVSRKGERRWVRVRGSVVDTDHGDGIIGTVVDVTSRHDREEALEAAVRARDEVLAIVSHDLRNPITAISGNVRLLIEDAADPALRSELLRSTQECTQQMSSLISNLLDVARIESGQLSVEIGDVDTRELFARVCRMFSTQAKERGLELISEPADSPIRGDVSLLAQALSNLVANALRHTDSGSVTLRAHLGEGAAILAVADTGTGIEPEDLPRLFDRFWQARSRREGGAGLGLAIVQGIVEAHGGSVSVESRPGSGSTFVLNLPMTDRAS